MVYLCFSPSWFFIYSIVFELCFAVSTLFVSVFAHRVYRETEQKQAKLLGISFIFISLSYFVEFFSSIYIYSRIANSSCPHIEMSSLALIDLLSLYSHIVFMTIGLVSLLYMTFKSKKPSIFWTSLIISLIAIFESINPLNNFILISTVALCFISAFFIKNYISNRKTSTLLIAAAFLSLLFGRFQFLFVTDKPMFYVFAHILQLLAYLLISINLYLITKHQTSKG